MKLKEREKRTIRLAIIGIAIYLGLFYGRSLWNSLESLRTEYQELRNEARNVRQEIQAYENKVLLLKELKEESNMDASAFSGDSLVAEASAAIQEAAKSSGVKLGPIRESSGRGSDGRLASMRLEGKGKVKSLVALLHRLEGLGYPIIVDSLQVDADPKKPNQLNMSMTIVILDYELWKQHQEEQATGEVSRA